MPTSFPTRRSSDLALTSVAALQLLEQGKLDLDSPASKWLPALADVQVLDGFASDGSPITRAPGRPVTMRHLLTHTSGFGYEFLSENVQKYQAATNTPSVLSATRASLQVPLLFDPGERWEYGIGLDWAGLVVEAISGDRKSTRLSQHVFAPLAMRSEEHTSELQSLMRISYAVFCLKNKR